jgi:hypothetical protein
MIICLELHSGKVLDDQKSFRFSSVSCSLELSFPYSGFVNPCNGIGVVYHLPIGFVSRTLMESRYFFFDS